MFRGHVGVLAGQSHYTADARDVDDRAAAVDERGCSGMGTAKDPGEIHIDQARERLGIDVLGRAECSRRVRASVVYEDVDAAQLALDAIDEIGNSSLVGNVGGRGERRSPAVFCLGGDFSYFLVSPRDGDDRSPGVGEAQRDRAPDPPTAAGDDCRLASSPNNSESVIRSLVRLWI